MSQPRTEHPIADLLSYLDASPTPYHAVRSVARLLDAAGFPSLRTDVRWDAGELEPGSVQRGYVHRGDGALLAWNAPGGDFRDGAIILAAHTDSPALRVKERGVAWRHGYLALPTELYGGPILSTWIDRELGVAGRIADIDGRVHLFEMEDRVVIPNVAIHLNRKVNEGFAFNAQDHLVALATADPGATAESANEWLTTRAARAVDQSVGLTSDRVVELEALLFDPMPGDVLAGDGSMFMSGRIDNLAGAYTNLRAFLDADSDRTRILVLYNHEEIGSGTGEGAHSAMLENLVARLIRGTGGDAEDVAVALDRSLVVSNDAAHAIHPSYADKHDTDYAPVLGGGPVLKVNGKYRYATTATSAARFSQACARAGISMQRVTNRSDIASGSTVGPITWAKTGIDTVDVGIPMLAMHSLRETAGSADVETMIRALIALIEE